MRQRPRLCILPSCNETWPLSFQAWVVSVILGSLSILSSREREHGGYSRWFYRFRAPKSTRSRTDADQASFGFLDGDFLERLLTLLDFPETLDKIWQGQSQPERLSTSVNEIRRLLEDLQSYHWEYDIKRQRYQTTHIYACVVQGRHERSASMK